MNSLRKITIILLAAGMLMSTPISAHSRSPQATRTKVNLPDREALTKLGYQLLGGASLGAFLGSWWATQKSKRLQTIKQDAKNNKEITVDVDSLDSLSDADKKRLQEKIAAYNAKLSHRGADFEQSKRELIQTVDSIKPVSNNQSSIARGAVCGFICTVLAAAFTFIDDYFSKKSESQNFGRRTR